MPDDIQRRQHYRLLYPYSERPRFHVGLTTWQVVDLSEGGAFLARGKADFPKEKAEVAGTIVFADSAQEQVAGTVIRHSRDGWVVRFEKGVSMRRMMEEQRRIIARYLRPDED